VADALAHFEADDKTRVLQPIPVALPVSPTGTGKRRRLRLPGRKVLIAVGIFVLLAVVFWWKRSGPRPDDQTSDPAASTNFSGTEKDFTNRIGMKFVRVPAGSFWMGGSGGTPNKRQEKIPHDFYLGIYAVTQAQWQAVMDKNPCHFARAGGGRDQVRGIVADADLMQFPVEMVSWEDAQQFLQKLNEREKGTGWRYRLPTEAEWEYACRWPAASLEECAFDFYFDQPTNDLSSRQANCDGNEPAGKAPKGPALQRTTKCGSYSPNRLGLYDMHGNVWQWCDNWHTEDAVRAVRGGSWTDGASLCRAASHFGYAPSTRLPYLGFRVARVPAGK
jgi:formylglycine-generating enzyme required for sulfatase activity